MRSSALVLLLSAFLFGCATGSPSTQNQRADDDIEDYVTDVYCFQSDPQQSAANRRETSLLPGPTAEERSEALAFLSPTSRQIAEVIQVEHLVSQIPLLEKDVSRDVAGARLRLIELRQALSDQVLVALFDAFSVAAELECEKGRADALASGMEEKQNDIQQRRTVIALLADATAGLLSGLFLFGGSDVLAGGADIIGNLLQGSFGWAALGGQQQYDLRLMRNHLKEVWEGPESSTLFPSSVWRFLNSPLTEGRIDSRRKLLVQEWTTRLGDMDSEKELPRKELFFGQGGTFSGSQLRQRAEMLDRVKASVRLMGKDLNLLFRESLGHLHGISQLANSGMVMLD
jgi:hypothetical protein